MKATPLLRNFYVEERFNEREAKQVNLACHQLDYGSVVEITFSPKYTR
jgi:hypothetical protein